MLASSTDVTKPYSSSVTFRPNPMAMGIMKAMMPWVNVRMRFFLKSPMFISRPARNMM